MNVLNGIPRQSEDALREICVAAIRVFNEHYSQLKPFGRVQKCFWTLSGLNGDRLTGKYPSNFGSVQSSIELLIEIKL